MSPVGILRSVVQALSTDRLSNAGETAGVGNTVSSSFSPLILIITSPVTEPAEV